VKIAKILSLLLVAALMLGIMASCVTTDAAEMSIKLTVRAGDDRVYNTTVKVVPSATDAEGKGTATVIEVLREAMAAYEFDIKIKDDGTSVTGFKNYTEKTVGDTNYYWIYTINGVEPSSGRANTNTVVDGDAIEYTLYCSMPDPADNSKIVTIIYTSDMGVYGENEGIEEEVEEEAE